VGRFGIVASPYISLTSSRDVAWAYAMIGPIGIASRRNPGYIYEIDITPVDIRDPKHVALFDPLKEIANEWSRLPTRPVYHHDSFPGILLGIAAPGLMALFLRLGLLGPASMAGFTIPGPSLGKELCALVHALRDAEVLALDRIPKDCVKIRHDAF
jgi:hypothetical protein